jgi:hypothetical protein
MGHFRLGGHLGLPIFMKEHLFLISCSQAFSALGGYGLSSILIMLRMLVSTIFPWLPCDGFFPKCVLTELSSFAIWDKNKVIMAISFAIWVINLGFQLAGKLISYIPCESQQIYFDIRYRKSK